MVTTQEKYKNPFSFIFGLLCLAVVYLHSHRANGFEIYAFGLENHTLKQIDSLLLHTVVPSFFICWGYLSNKYFYNKESILVFFKRKFYKFYPLFFISFCLSFIEYPDMLSLPLWKILIGSVGLYYESGFTGGNIFIVIIYVLITISFFKLINVKKWKLYVFCIFCLIVSKFIPHESRLCYFRYFGYYTAFWIGVSLKEVSLFDKPCNLILNLILVLVSSIVPLLNKFGLYFLCIEYQPNSPEQLFFSFAILYMSLCIIKQSRVYCIDFRIFKIINFIGNNAYGHFIIHHYIILLFILVGTLLNLNSMVVQILIIFFVSFVTVYFFLVPYNSMIKFFQKSCKYWKYK